jgi:hypothetical protein
MGLTITQFPRCCALDTVVNFSSYDCDEDGPTEYSPEWIKEQVEQNKENAKYTTEHILGELDAMAKGHKDGSGGHYRRGGALATLNDEQLEFWGPKLEERGWKNIASIGNPNSDLNVHIFLLDHGYEVDR